MKLIIASNNENKIREIKQILGDYFEEIVSQREAGINIDVVEDGDRFIDNARLKAKGLMEALPDNGEKVAILADDSGLTVDALDGEPGVYSARYAGEGHNDDANNAKLLMMMSEVPDEKRSAKFVCAMVLAFRDEEPIEGIGYCRGMILRKKQGENGFGYDPLFWFKDFDASFAQLTAEQKNSVSHRSAALRLIKKGLDERRGAK